MAKRPSRESRKTAKRMSAKAKHDTRRSNERARQWAEEGTRHATEAANYGLDWMRDFAAQSLAQSRVVFDGFFHTARRTFEALDQQATDVRHGSMSLAEEAFASTFEFAQKCASASSPQGAAKLQTEYFERQAQIFANHSKDLGQKIMHTADKTAKSTISGMHATGEQARRRAMQTLPIG